MLGALAGDIIGSVYEHQSIKTKAFPLFSPHATFTDDTVLTVALAEAILHDLDYSQVIRAYYRRYPHAGYGGSFHRWARTEGSPPYNSWGNGAAMRTSPVGYAFDTLEEVLARAKRYAEITHNHPEGIKGAQATSAAILLARMGEPKAGIRRHIQDAFGYDLGMTCDQIRPTYTFDISCQGTVPQAIIAFLDSTDFEDSLRNAISLGGDSDTLACITGGIAQAFYGGVPAPIAEKALDILDHDLRQVTLQFMATYPHPLPAV